MQSPTKIFISGATSGIGSYLARHYAAQNCELFLHGRDKKKLAKLKAALDSSAVTTLCADFRSPSGIAAMFDEIKRSTKKIDVLINNAFGKLEVPLKDAKGEELAEFFQVSIAGTAEVIRNSIPLLRKGRRPRIINIVADWGMPMHNIMTGSAPYISAKYAVHGLGAALQTEVNKFGIRTTNLCPGVVAADAAFDMPDAGFDEKYGEEAINPKDIAGAIDFVLHQRTTHVRSIVLSPRNRKYNGL